MKRCVIIPVYTDKIDKNEELALRQLIQVFKDEEIVILTYRELSIPYIQNMLQLHRKNRSEYFHVWYFRNVNRYNQLMLSKGFYDRFKDYDYILICQLDVYVFSNQLEYWCKRNYDYIGAPLFNHSATLEFGNCYNGGFSLRKVSMFLKMYSSDKWFNFICGRTRFIRFVLAYLFACVTKYNIRITIPYSSSGEDTIWSRLDNVPTFEESARFGFEKYPSYLFSITNSLPFGCHAYKKWDDGFYSQFIVIYW